jgi:hypothetical protein
MSIKIAEARPPGEKSPGYYRRWINPAENPSKTRKIPSARSFEITEKVCHAERSEASPPTF